MEHLRFVSSDEFIEWANRVVTENDQHYARVPVALQTWTYGDGHTATTRWGLKRRKNSTVLANLKFLRKTGTGELEHPTDERLVKDINARGGVEIAIDWGDYAARS